MEKKAPSFFLLDLKHPHNSLLMLLSPFRSVVGADVVGVVVRGALVNDVCFLQVLHNK